MNILENDNALIDVHIWLLFLVALLACVQKSIVTSLKML